MRIRRSAIGLFCFAIFISSFQIPIASAATYASGTPCEVVVSSSANLSYSLNSGARQCTYNFAYNATSRTITLPINLVSAVITLTGASGGRGGPRNDGSTTTYALTSSYVGKYSGTIPSASSKQIEIHTGGIGANGTNPSRDGAFHSGPAGGITSYPSGGDGGIGGGQRGSYDSAPISTFAGGTGGGGGAATVAVINGTPIFAGGGGGTGGTGRKDSNVNWEGGAAFSNATSQASQFDGVAGDDNPSSNTDSSCGSNGGAGGGGGGGYQGGNGGIYGAPRCNAPKVFIQSTGGYPGSNGTTYSLTSTTSSYPLSSTLATGSAGGVAIIVITYKGSTTATLSIPTGDLVYRQSKVISVTSSVAGRITFTVAGKVLPGCKNKASNAANSYTVTCSYKPSTHSTVTISDTLDPTDPLFIGTVSSSAQFLVGNRTGPRVQ